MILFTRMTKYTTRYNYALLAIFIICTCWLGNIHFTNAASDNAHGLQISPVKVNILADPGKTYNFKISILNVTTGSLIFKPNINDFKSKDETGEPEIIMDDSAPGTTIKSWISPLNDIFLKAKQSVNVNVTVTVPPDASPGGHYGVIRFSGIPPELEQSGVALAASAGPLVLIRVSGNINESLYLKEFFTSRGDQRSAWFENAPIYFSERIHNNGNIHLNPIGDVVVTNILGKHVATLKVNEQDGSILPESTRRFDQKLEKNRMFGRYTAKIALAYGTTGQVLMGTTTFWVIPYKIILLAIAILGSLILTIKRMMKKYNAKIIQRAKDEIQKNNE